MDNLEKHIDYDNINLICVLSLIKKNNKFFSKRERYTYAKSVNNSDNKNYV